VTKQSKSEVEMSWFFCFELSFRLPPTSRDSTHSKVDQIAGNRKLKQRKVRAKYAPLHLFAVFGLMSQLLAKQY
jgi:hypothetical protein